MIRHKNKQTPKQSLYLEINNFFFINAHMLKFSNVKIFKCIKHWISNYFFLVFFTQLPSGWNYPFSFAPKLFPKVSFQNLFFPKSYFHFFFQNFVFRSFEGKAVLYCTVLKYLNKEAIDQEKNVLFKMYTDNISNIYKC